MFLSCTCTDAKERFPEFLREMFDKADKHPDGKLKRRRDIVAEAGGDDLCACVCVLFDAWSDSCLRGVSIIS